MRIRGLRGIRRGVGDDTALSFPFVDGSTPATSVPAGSGSDWTQFWQNLTTSGVKILGSVVTPPAYEQTTRDAYGNLVSTTVRNQATGNTALTAAAGGLPAISSNALLIGGGILAVALIAMSMGRRG